MIFLLKFLVLTLAANALILPSVAFSTYLDVSPDTLEASTELARSDDVAKPTVEIRDDLFFIDGKQTRLLSGSIHYFRIVPELWEDRLLRLKAMGLNAITVYVAWNRHETKRGEFDFESPENDLEHFLQLAQNLNLYVIFRPGPYICAEWDFGGFPAWMLENGTIPLRTYAQPYLSFVDAFYDKLLPRIRPFLHIESGGPVLMVQVENEYGHFGDASTNPNDAKYLKHLIELTRKHLGDQIILFTTDPSDKIHKGSLPGDIIYTFVDGCHHPPGDYHKQQTMNPPGSSPFFCTETYTGWLSHWSEPKMQTRTTQKVTQDVKKVLDQVGGNASVSLYMGYGGTNFGFWSGSNWGDGKLQPHITSYDYNAPIAEGGENGVDKNGVDKFEGFRDLFKSKSPELEFASPPPLPPRVSSSMKLPFTHSIPLLAPEHLDAVTSLLKSGLQEPLAAETFGCYYGFVLYSGHLNHATKSGVLQLPKFQDRAHVFADGERLGISYRNDANHSVFLPSLKPGVEIAILVEHMGRINFDPNGMRDTRFGLFGSPLLEGIPLPLSWTARCLDFSSPKLLDNLQWTPQTRIKRGQQHEPPRLPAFFMTEVTSKANLVASKDLFLRPEHDSKEAVSGKGVIWYNGFNAGRYWTQEGPQRSLYVPGPRTESKSPSREDRIVVLELEQAAEHIWLEGEPKNIL